MGQDPVLTSVAARRSSWPTVAPDGEVARLMLAFLASAGLFYVCIMPALVDGLVSALGFSNRDAGFTGSANVYGAALGALFAVFLIKKVSWRRAAVALLLALIAIDLLSMLLRSPAPLIPLRFLHGCAGGALVGIGFGVIARQRHADRTFGYLLTVQFGVGGAALMVLPSLVAGFGAGALFFTLIAFSAATLAMLPFLPEYPYREPLAATHSRGRVAHMRLFALALLTIFLFQAANMGVYAFMIGLGRNAGLDLGFISATLGVAAWIAIAGSVLVIVMSIRFGRTLPLVLSLLITIAAVWALHSSAMKLTFWGANAVLAVTWAIGNSYLLGLCSAFDETGQMAAMGGFASKMGLASGPFAGALLLVDGNYDRLLNIAVAVFVVCLVVMIAPARYLDRLQPARESAQGHQS